MKKIIIGFIAGVLIASAFPAAADTIYKKLTATERLDYTLEVDGSKVKLNSPIVTIAGSSYLPVRDIGNAVGKEVDFKGGTISLDSEKEVINPQERLEALEEALSVKKSSIVKLEEYIETLKDEPESAKKIESALNAIKVTEENVSSLEKEIAELKSKYPELN